MKSERWKENNGKLRESPKRLYNTHSLIDIIVVFYIDATEYYVILQQVTR